MKTIIITLFLILSISASAQLNPKIAFDYFPYKSEIRMANFYAQSGNAAYISHYNGMFRVRVGADYSIKKFTIYFDQKVYMNKASGVSFRPLQAEWFAGLSYSITAKVKVTYEHLCIHPILTDGKDQTKIFGGYDVISISYGY
jgi:hypothetical protein